MAGTFSSAFSSAFDIGAAGGNRRRRTLLRTDRMILKQSTIVSVIVGPVLDSAGAEYATLAVTELSASKNGGTLTALTSGAPPTLTVVANGYYTLDLSATEVNTVGTLQITCNKVSYQMPPLNCNVVEEAVYVDLFAASAPGYGTAQTGDTYFLANGVTGFAAIDTVVDAILVDTGTSIPDTLAGIGTSGGAAISVDATVDNFAGGISGVTSGTTVVGTQAATTYANTSFDDGVYHDITHAANTLDVVYQFLTGGGTSPVSVTFNGYLDSANDTVTVSAWDHGVLGAWEPIGTILGQGGTVDLVKTLSLYTRHIGTSAAELGKVYIRLNCTGSSPILHVDQLFVDYSVTSRSVGYANGEVWIDTVSGVAGTEDFVNGVADNPVLTLADALTIATSVNLRKFWVGNGSTITLAATTANKVFEGHEWTLALGGQNIAESMFIDADVTGTSTGADAEFEDCIFGTSSMVAYQAYNCSYTGTQTFSAAGNYRLINCQSGVPGSSAPTFALGTGDMNVEFRRWSGGIILTGIGANDVLTISGELGTINLSSATAGTVEIRGTYKAITNASSGVTVNTAGAILGGDVATILADTNELQTDWADGGRLDLIQDIIAVDTTTDIPALIATAQADLDIITGASGVNLLTATQASIDAILVDTAEIGAAGVGLTAVALADATSDTVLADAIWNAATVTYGTAGTYGEHVESLSAGGDATEAKQDLLIAAVITNAAGVDIAADIIALKAETVLIVADTNELQTDWANGGRLDLILDATVVADTVNITTSTTIIEFE